MDQQLSSQSEAKTTKQKGSCPFCGEVVEPNVVEKNAGPRRDRCECPNCGESVYLCRMPACHNYAKWTENWDHEYCPACWGLLKSLAAKAGVVLVDLLPALLALYRSEKGTRSSRR